MPVQQERCEFGDAHDVCPECESKMVTPCDNPGLPTPNSIVVYAAEETPVTYAHVCWDCGWREEVTMTVERS